MRMNCAFSCNDAYVQHAGVGIISIFENNRDIDEIYIYFIENQISDENKKKLNSIALQYNCDGKRKIIYIDLFKITSALNVSTDFTLSTYGKLFLGQIEEVDRILCFDSDIVCTASLRELLTIDMKSASVLGVQDTVNPYFVKIVGKDQNYRYINCGGVIVIDLKKWRKSQMEKKFISYINQWNGNPPFVDQGTINKLCVTGILSAKFNVINPMLMFPVDQLKKLYKLNVYYSQDEIDTAIKFPAVVHYTGELFNRPWSTDCTHPLKKYYLKYLAISPWKGNLIQKPFSKNCIIQNWVYYNCPFCVYKLMLRFIEIRHIIFKRSMVGG